MEDENVTLHNKGNFEIQVKRHAKSRFFAFIASTSIAHEEAHLTGVVGIP